MLCNAGGWNSGGAHFTRHGSRKHTQAAKGEARKKFSTIINLISSNKLKKQFNKMEIQTNKSHRSKKSGRSVEKKKKPQKHPGSNPKAFAFASGGNANRIARRNMEKQEKRLHVPLIDRNPTMDPPPVVIAVVGPPKV